MTDINIDGIVTWLSNWFQDKLVSGQNIKTVNNQSLLGSGNISISGGSGGGLSIDDIYPVGAIYISANNTDPSILFGGTWEQIKDKFLLSCGDTYANGTTGGSATVSLTQSEMPRHTHTQNSHSHKPATTDLKFLTSKENIAINGTARAWTSQSSSGTHYVYSNDGTTGVNEDSTTQSVTATNKYTGGTNTTEATQNGSAHENMPPYMTVYMWRRTG